MKHFLHRKTADVIARGEEPPWGGLYAPPADLCVANPPAKKSYQERYVGAESSPDTN
jgi:hypothetical protein